MVNLTAIQINTVIGVSVYGDGISTSFSFDLKEDIYSVPLGLEHFSTELPPTSVVSADNTVSSVSISGSVVTVNLISPIPAGTSQTVAIRLIFS